MATKKENQSADTEQAQPADVIPVPIIPDAPETLEESKKNDAPVQIVDKNPVTQSKPVDKNPTKNTASATASIYDRTYAELTADTMLCFLVEREKFGTDKFTDEATAEKEDVHQYHTKAFWERIEKDEKGNPRYIRIKLLGIAVKDENGKYIGFKPFKS